MGKLPARVQINYLHIEPDAATPQLTQRLNNTTELLGDEWLSNGGIGEFTGGSPFGGLGSLAWMNGTRLVAQHGWRNENHSLSTTDFSVILDFWNQVNTELKTTGIPQSPCCTRSPEEDRRESRRHHPAALGGRARAIHHADLHRAF